MLVAHWPNLLYGVWQKKQETIFCCQFRKRQHQLKFLFDNISVHFCMIVNLQSQNAFMRAAQDGRRTFVFLLLGLGATVNSPDKVSEIWMFPDCLHNSFAIICLMDRTQASHNQACLMKSSCIYASMYITNVHHHVSGLPFSAYVGFTVRPFRHCKAAVRQGGENR